MSRSSSWPFLSDACGFPVTVTTERVADVTLFYDKNGLIVHEFDRAPGAHGTMSGNGNSITFELTEIRCSPTPWAQPSAPRPGVVPGCGRGSQQGATRAERSFAIPDAALDQQCADDGYRSHSPPSTLWVPGNEICAPAGRDDVARGETEASRTWIQ